MHIFFDFAGRTIPARDLLRSATQLARNAAHAHDAHSGEIWRTAAAVPHGKRPQRGGERNWTERESISNWKEDGWIDRYLVSFF